MTGAGIAAAMAAAVANAFALVLQAAEARQIPARESMHLSLLRRLAHRAPAPPGGHRGSGNAG